MLNFIVPTFVPGFGSPPESNNIYVELLTLLFATPVEISWIYFYSIINSIFKHSLIICYKWYARSSREVKAGIPCSIGAGRRGFDPRQPQTHEACLLSAWRFEMKLSPPFFCCYKWYNCSIAIRNCCDTW